MTVKQFEAMGFDVSETGRVWHGHTETEFKVSDYKKISMTEFINRFHNVAFENGMKYGSTLKTEEIRRTLGFDK